MKEITTLRKEVPIMRNSILVGDCIAVLKTLPESSVQCVVTSPP